MTLLKSLAPVTLMAALAVTGCQSTPQADPDASPQEVADTRVEVLEKRVADAVDALEKERGDVRDARKRVERSEDRLRKAQRQQRKAEADLAKARKALARARNESLAIQRAAPMSESTQ